MSGGVDSSLAAALLVEKGYDVTGVHLVCWEEPGCRAPEDRKDALAVALRLGIPFEVLDFQEEYQERVIEYFYREYEAGRTPNPDVVCNREIKFGLFLEWSLRNGFGYVATGHYARIKNQGQYHLLKGVDPKKDQSYFLYTLTQEQLKHILFPVGHLIKEEVRREARRRGLPTADKPDSVGICFVGDVDVQEFLRRRISEKHGEVVDTDGNVIGEHKGVWFYTIGQRHGFTINSNIDSQVLNLKHAIPPLYVVSKDVARNKLVVGFGPETYNDLFSVRDVHWINGFRKISNLHAKGRAGKSQISNLSVRIRHGGELIPGELTFKGSTLHGVRLSEPQRGIAPGQAVVFYRDNECLGGGVIS